MGVLASAAAETDGDDAEEKAQDPAFERYQSIIDRMPFGEPPPNFDPTQPPGSAAAVAAAAAAKAEGMTEQQRTEEEQRLASSVRVSVLNITPAGRTMVGFTDSGAQPPEHYYLPVGGERNGWKVKSAEPAEEMVTLTKGEVEVTLKLGEGPTGDGKDGGKKKGAHPGLPAMRRGGLMRARLAGGQPTAPAPDAAGGGVGGAMARLRERRQREMMKQQAEAKLKADAEAEEKADRERRAIEAEQAAAEREQQRNTLLQIQEELRRQREEKERQREEKEQAEGQSEGQTE